MKDGYDVTTVYESLSTTAGDSTLGSLRLSSIPFVFDATVTASGTISLSASNVYEVTETLLTAMAKDPDTIITVSGVRYTDTEAVVIALQEGDTIVDIIVTVGASRCTG